MEQESKLDRLRQRAENLLRVTTSKSVVSRDDIDVLIHELQVYEAELKLQHADLETANDRLKDSRRQYDDLFENAPVGYFLTDDHGQITKFNHKLVSLLGVPAEELKNARFDHFVTRQNRDRYHRHRRQVHNTGEEQTIDLAIRRGDDEVAYIRLSSTFIANKSLARNAIIDITVTKAAELQAQALLDEQKRLTQLQGRIIDVISHELRTPLSKILLASEMLERYDDKMSVEKKQERFQSIRNHVMYLSGMINEIGAAQDMNRYEQRLHLKPVAVIPFMRQIIADFQLGMQERVRFDIEVETCREATTIETDENLFRLILMNLLDNALKYSDDEVEVRLTCQDDGIIFYVIDHGIGIPGAEYDNIFDPFYRGSNVRGMPGTGIGLSMVKRAIELIDGQIRIGVPEGGGTRVVIGLPDKLFAINGDEAGV